VLEYRDTCPMHQRPYIHIIDVEPKINENEARTDRKRPTKTMMTRKGLMLEKLYESEITPRNSIPVNQPPIVVKLGNGQYSHGFFYMIVHATFVAASMSVGAAVRVTMHQLLLYNGADADIEDTWRYVGGTWLTSIAMFVFSLTIVYCYQIWTYRYTWFESRCKHHFRSSIQCDDEAMSTV
jgi:hypothetical protein